MGRAVRRWRTVLAAGGAAAAVALGGLPALADDLSPQVSAVRTGIDAAAERLAAAEAAIAALDVRLAVLADERTGAQRALDAAAAARDAAVEARQLAERHAAAAAADAEVAAAERVAAGQRLQAAVDHRDRHTRDLGTLAAQAYKQGGDTAKALGVVDALTTAERDVGTVLAAVERLGLGAERTVDLVAEAEARARAAAAGREEADRSAQDARAAAERADAAVDERRSEERRGEVDVAAADRALAEVAARIAATGEQRQAAEAERAASVESLLAANAALSTVRHLGGAPGPHGLSWPTDGSPTSGFGPRFHPIHHQVRQHQGIDIPAPTGQPVLSAAAGTVITAGPRGGYGLTVEVDHGHGRTTLSAHLSAIDVRVGQRVREAQRIGAVGSTGQSTGPHLHFEVRVDGRPVDPMGHYSP